LRLFENKTKTSIPFHTQSSLISSICIIFNSPQYAYAC